MSNLVDRLLAAYELVLKEPWSTALSGKERAWFLVYDPAEQRKEAVINKGINSMCRIGSNDVIPIAMKLVAL